MLSDTTDYYDTRTKEQLIEVINKIQKDRRELEKENRKLKEKIAKLEFIKKTDEDFIKKLQG